MEEARSTKPRLRLDDQGQALPFTPEEREAQRVAVLAMLGAIRLIPDEPDEVRADEVFRAIDSYRPHHPLFEGYY